MSILTHDPNMIIARAESRRRTALGILEELKILELWSAFGKPVIVGAVAYDLVVAPDIDIEIYCNEPRMEHGFSVIRECISQPRIEKAVLAKGRHRRDGSLYWQLSYAQHGGSVWNIDMWSLGDEYSGTRAAVWVDPIRQVLTEETRLAILTIKEFSMMEPTVQYNSTLVYHAVLEAGVRSVEQFTDWLQRARGGTRDEPSDCEHRILSVWCNSETG